MEVCLVKNLMYTENYPLQHMLTKARKKRTYFDSGHFALSAADRVTDNGAIQTGGEHPHYESISHPYFAMPAASNIDKSANKDSYGKSTSPEMSPLLQKTNFKYEEPTEKEGQDKPISHEG